MKSSLHIEIAATFQIEAVPSLFDPANETLPAAIGDARRLVVVSDQSARDRMPSLQACLHAWQESGRLDHHLSIEVSPHEDTADLDACQRVVEAGIRGQLGRHDTFVGMGGERVNRVVALAATSFRRFTSAIRIHRDLPSLVATVQAGNKVICHDEPIAVIQRDTHVLIDQDGLISARAVDAEERTTLLSLALLDTGIRDLLNQLADMDIRGDAAIALRSEGLRAVFDLCQRLGPGHEAWRMGETWLPFTPKLEPPERRATSLILAARAAERLGMLTREALNDIYRLADRLHPDLAGLRDPADHASVPQWLHDRKTSPELTVALPTGAEHTAVNTLSKDALVRALGPRQIASRPAGIHHQRSPRREDPSPPMLRTVTVFTTDFTVEFRSDLLDPQQDALTHLLPPGACVLAIVDAYAGNIAKRVRQCLGHYRRSGLISQFAVLPIDVSSQEKTLELVFSLTRTAKELGLGTGDRILVVGGGTIMDIAGYAAFMYSGDTPYIRIPTTLVGMIDAGIGLKVGANMGDRKNFVGAYHAPIACVRDMYFLRTLPVEELRCGAAEAIKMGIICDAHLFELLERHHDALLSGADTPEVREILDRSISTMLYQLEQNPFEDSLRRLPDFGHEFGHMLESLSGYRLRHGEAVAIGMALSCHLATSAGYLSRAELERILMLLTAVGLPLWDPVCDADVLWRKLRDDVVPHKAGYLHLVVPISLGTGSFIDSLDEISPALLNRACSELRARSEGHASPAPKISTGDNGA